MTTQSDTPGEGLDPKALYEGCKAFLSAYRDPAATPSDYAREVAAAIRAYLAASPSVASDTAEDAADIEAAQLALQEYREKGGTSLADIKAELASDTAALPSGYEGLADKIAADTFNHLRHWQLDEVVTDAFHGAIQKAAREAIAALGRVEPVAVKPLEWRHLPDAFPPMWVTKTTIGSYHIEETAGSDSPSYDVLNPMAGPIANVDGLPEAKAVAQADYERRILSALVHPPASQPALASQGEAAQLPAEHKWLDPECGANGCQSLLWKARYESAVKGRQVFRQAYREAREAAQPAAEPVAPAASQDGGRYDLC